MFISGLEQTPDLRYLVGPAALEKKYKKQEFKVDPKLFVGPLQPKEKIKVPVPQTNAWGFLTQIGTVASSVYDKYTALQTQKYNLQAAREMTKQRQEGIYTRYPGEALYQEPTNWTNIAIYGALGVGALFVASAIFSK